MTTPIDFSWTVGSFHHLVKRGNYFVDAKSSRWQDDDCYDLRGRLWKWFLDLVLRHGHRKHLTWIVDTFCPFDAAPIEQSLWATGSILGDSGLDWDNRTELASFAFAATAAVDSSVVAAAWVDWTVGLAASVSVGMGVSSRGMNRGLVRE